MSELADYLPADALTPLTESDTPMAPAGLVDRAVRRLAARALEVAGAEEAAARIRALPEVDGGARARETMPALERIARATSAPPALVRAASQAAAGLISLESPGGSEGAEGQLVSAVVRLAFASVRAGLSAAEVVSELSAPTSR